MTTTETFSFEQPVYTLLGKIVGVMESEDGSEGMALERKGELEIFDNEDTISTLLLLSLGPTHEELVAAIKEKGGEDAEDPEALIENLLEARLIAFSNRPETFANVKVVLDGAATGQGTEDGSFYEMLSNDGEKYLVSALTHYLDKQGKEDKFILDALNTIEKEDIVKILYAVTIDVSAAGQDGHAWLELQN